MVESRRIWRTTRTAQGRTVRSSPLTTPERTAMEIFYNTILSMWKPLQVYTIVIAKSCTNNDVAIFIQTKSRPEIPEKDSWEIAGEIPLEWNPWGIVSSQGGETNLLISLVALFVSNPFAPITTAMGKEFLEQVLTQELKNILLNKEVSIAPPSRPDQYSSEYGGAVISASVRQAFRPILKEARKILVAQEIVA